MGMKAILPLVDMVFLGLGALLGVMTQMERVESIPVQIAQVGHDAAIVQQGDFRLLTLTSKGLTLDSRPITRTTLLSQSAGEDFVLRIQKDVPTEQTLKLLADLVGAGCDVSLEVDELSLAPSR